ncbi:hypothetical protein, partial [Bradyrhizobium cosmicum]
HSMKCVVRATRLTREVRAGHSERRFTMSASTNKAAYNVGGAIVGILLALLAIFGLIQTQGNQEQSQKYQSKISYDG